MRFMKWVADASMACGKNLIPLSFSAWRIQFNTHQLIHIAQHQHVTIKLYHTLVLRQRERCKLGPTRLKAWIVAVVFLYSRQQILHALQQNTAFYNCFVAVWRKVIGVQHNQRIDRFVLAQRIVEGENTR